MVVGYVYYEGDGFRAGRNPYVPPNVSNPSVWFSAMQKKLRGGNVNERGELTKGFFAKYYNEDEPSVEPQEKFCNAYFEDIDNERARIGGDWVVPHAILLDKSIRDLVRYKTRRRILGSDCTKK